MLTKELSQNWFSTFAVKYFPNSFLATREPVTFV